MFALEKCLFEGCNKQLNSNHAHCKLCTVPWETLLCPPLSNCATKLTYHPFKQLGFSVNNREKQPPIPVRVAFVFIVLTLPFSLLKNTLKKKKTNFQRTLLNFLWMLSTKEMPSSERQNL